MNWAALDPGLLGWPFVAGLLVLATHVPLGRRVLARGIIFLDLAIAQIAVLGVIVAHTLGWETQGWQTQLAAVAAALAGAAFLAWCESRWPDIQEALIGSSFAVAASLALRRPYRVDVIRDRGTLAREVPGGRIENVYRLQVMNASESAQRFHVAVEGLPGIAIASVPELDVDATGERSLAVRVQVPVQTAEAAGPGARPIRFDIRREGDERPPLVERSTFLIPR